MSNIVKDLRTYLVSKSAVTSIVSTRVYLGELPQGASLPAVTLNLIASQHSKYLGGTDNLRRSTIQVDCYEATTGSTPYTSAYTLGDKIRDYVEFQRGTWGASTVRRSLLEDTRDFIDEPADGSEFSRRGRSLDVVVWHVEAAPST